MAAFFRDWPKRLGGILTTSRKLVIENNCDAISEFLLMNLWETCDFLSIFK